MTIAIATALASVLGVLSALHLFWAIRGSVGDSVVIPKLGGKPVFAPSRASSAAVAAALAIAGWLSLLSGRVLPSPLPGVLVTWAAIGAGVVFCMRAIGDFRLVGFFKRVRGTDFARWDYFLFSPLCTLIAAAYLYLATR